MSACFALVEAQVVILRQCRMIALIRPVAGVAEDEVVRIHSFRRQSAIGTFRRFPDSYPP